MLSLLRQREFATAHSPAAIHREVGHDELLSHLLITNTRSPEAFSPGCAEWAYSHPKQQHKLWQQAQ